MNVEPPQQHITKSPVTDDKSNILLQRLMKIRRKLSMLIPMHSKSKTKERSILVIDTDLPRTFAQLDQMKPILSNLGKVLQAFTMYRPDIGYI